VSQSTISAYNTEKGINSVL